jgi:ResB-like family
VSAVGHYNKNSMSTASPAPQPAADALEQRDPWRSAWQGVTNDVLLAALCLIAGAASAAAYLLPQMPAGGTADPLSYSQWQTRAHTLTGAFYDAADTLGLFNAAQVFWLRMVCVILAVIVALRLADRLARLLAARHEGDWLRDEERLRVTDQAPTLADLNTRLRRAHYRVVASAAGNEPGWLAVDRAPWAELASIGLHLGLLVAVVGLLLNSTLGWDVARQQVDSDSATQLPRSNLSLQASAADNGQQTAVLQLLSENRGVALALGQRVPLYWVRELPVPCCLALQLSEVTPGFHINALSAAGTPLTITTSSYAEPATDVLLILRRDEPGRLVAVEASNLALLVSGDKGGSVKVYGVPLGNVLTDTQIRPSIAISGTILQFKPTTSMVVAVQYRPGDGLMWAGGLLALLGLIAVSAWPMQRLVVRHHGHWTEFYASGRWVRRVVRELAQSPVQTT